MKPVDLRVEGSRQGAIETARNRIILIMALFVLGFFTLAGKLILVGVFQANTSPYYQKSTGTKSALMARADIVDRNGIILATNLKTPSLAISKKRMRATPEELAQKVSDVLPEMDFDDVLSVINLKGNHHYIKRKLTPKQEFEIKKIGDPGLVTSNAEKRIYPHGRLAAHVLGAVDVDNNPKLGVEAYFDEQLSDPSKSEESLELSIDLRLQYVLRQELFASKEKFSAKGAAGIILDVRSGEVLALSSLPDFDPNDLGGPKDLTEMNKILQGRYELGSGFKTFTIASGLDHGVVRLSDGYDATKPVVVGGFTIRDDHPKERWLNIPEIFAYSSNIGTLMLAQDLGVDRQMELFDKLGMFRKTDIEVFEKSNPDLPDQWGPTELATTSYGHGIAVTPLHLATGMSAMVNGGRLIPATLVRKNASEFEGVTDVSSEANLNDYEQIISPDTSEIMRNLLHLAVEVGTGKNAKVDGYLIGGKTGTADKVENGKYSRRAVVSSFVSVFPIDEPKYLIFAMLDKPQGIEETFNIRTAGMTAAPMVGKIIERVGPLLGLSPTKQDEIEYQDLMLVSGEDR